MRTLLLGLGNPIASDDAVGLRLARELGQRLVGTPGLEIQAECSVGGLELLDVVCGYERLIVIDSIKTAGGRPGTWYRFNASSLHSTLHLDNVHDTNFATALELGRRLGLAVPCDEAIHVFAVEVAEISQFGERLSPDLELALPELLAELLPEIEALLVA